MANPRHSPSSLLPVKGGAEHARLSRILDERLRELGILPNALPHHVIPRLRAIVEREAERISKQLSKEVDALYRRADAQMRKKVSHLVTFKSVGRAFVPVAETPQNSAADQAHPGPIEGTES